MIIKKTTDGYYRVIYRGFKTDFKIINNRMITRLGTVLDNGMSADVLAFFGK